MRRQDVTQSADEPPFQQVENAYFLDLFPCTPQTFSVAPWRKRRHESRPGFLCSSTSCVIAINQCMAASPTFLLDQLPRMMLTLKCVALPASVNADREHQSGI